MYVKHYNPGYDMGTIKKGANLFVTLCNAVSFNLSTAVISSLHLKGKGGLYT